MDFNRLEKRKSKCIVGGLFLFVRWVKIENFYSFCWDDVVEWWECKWWSCFGERIGYFFVEFNLIFLSLEVVLRGMLVSI